MVILFMACNLFLLLEIDSNHGMGVSFWDDSNRESYLVPFTTCIRKIACARPVKKAYVIEILRNICMVLFFQLVCLGVAMCTSWSILIFRERPKYLFLFSFSPRRLHLKRCTGSCADCV